MRYPVGFNHRHNCIGAMAQNSKELIGYIESRKHIYLPLYCKLVRQEEQFKELKNRLNKGENLLIIEVDGPHQESMNYYQEQYNVDNYFIENNTMLITPKNIDIMLNDIKHPFGHGYCLGMALLDLDIL